MVSPARLCLFCKGGRALCGNSPCPLMPRFRIEPRMQKIDKDFFGPGYSVFVGRQGYPGVNMGPLAGIESRPGLDDPGAWFNMGYSDIIEMRSLLLRSKQRVDVHARSRIVSEAQELVLASGPTDIEMSFKKKPVYRVSFSDVSHPMGPSAPLERLRITENPRIPGSVDRIVSDELRANQAGFELYRTGQDVYRISSILSSGALGLERSRKLVPTRWSITASQTMIADRLIEQIKEYPSINEYRIYSSEFLDNHFEILLMPGSWEFENFEAWAPGSMWASQLKKMEILEEYEPYRGRTKYAEKQGGGFYSSRLGVTEGLAKLKRQARVVVFREIHEGYTIPVGCWQILENVRNAFRQPYIKFDTKEEALSHINPKLRATMEEYISQSVILRQRRLQDFMKHI